MNTQTIVVRFLRSAAPLCLWMTFPIWSANSTAHEPHDPPLRGAIYPSVSPDGKSVAFAHLGAIWRIPRVGGVASRLTRASGFDCWPAWSPDGERIAFIRGRNSTIGPVQLVQASNGQTIEIDRNPEAKGKLRFSPDGERLLGLFRRDGSEWSLCWFDLESGEFGARLHPDSRGLVYDVSHDGTRIAFATTLDVP